MPMDFLRQQEHARRKTRRLIFYFALAVLLIIAAVYLVILFTLGFFPWIKPVTDILNAKDATGWGAVWGAGLWQPKLFLAVSAGTIAVVVAGSLIKMNELSNGGGSLAMRMGGHQLNPDASDPNERELCSGVEEMAIASGIPVPAVYVLDDEQAINAFAAGYSPRDAIIGVTRGCMKLLTRDELQGVIAHEFSHILNGDMRLNMRLIGWVFGILCLVILGKILLRSRGRNNALPFVGIGLLAVGGVGAFFGRLIQSAISREREFLADASAVQFTRNPDGLGGALKKIGGLSCGSRLSTEYADETGHLFFGNALGGAWFGWLATHPPLEERIRRIEPGFDGMFPRVAIETEAAPVLPGRVARQFGVLDILGTAAAALPSVPAAGVVSRINQPLPDHLVRAGGILSALPEALTQAAREPFDANALIYAMLLSSDDAVRPVQLKSLETEGNPGLVQMAVKLFPAVAGLERDARLALAAMAMPALRRLTPAQYEIFTRGVQRLVEADQEIDLFEYALQKMTRRCLESQFRPAQKMVVQYYVLKPLIEDSAVLLSALAHVGQENDEQARTAFRAGLERLGLDPNQ